MIQPVNNLTSQTRFRGSDGNSLRKHLKVAPNSKIAVMNAAGTAAAAGGLTAAISRAYTSSWAHAGVLGLFGSFLTMFFMTPHLIDTLVSFKPGAKNKAEALAKEDAVKVADVVKENVRSARKYVQFKQQA